MRILLVEDHKRLSRALKRGLEKEGFAVDLAGDGEEADRKASGASYDVIILDLMLMKIGGLSLLQQGPKNGAGRILVLTAKDDRVIECEVKDPILRLHDLEINIVERTIRRAGRSIYLTPREFDVLHCLALHCGKVVTCAKLWEHLYDEDDEYTSNIIDVYIRYLRKKIDKGFDTPLILTRWGHGYMLRSEED